MDYVIGSVAALVTGNVTPSRPRLVKRALTPTKHQPSPNVTPKSEFVEDRSIFLSPSMQKKKAIVKKSPKRIFQNPDLETTDNGDGELSITSPKADKVKKHLKDELDSENVAGKSTTESKSPKNKGKNKKESLAQEESSKAATDHISNDNSPKKKKKKNNSVIENSELPPAVQSESIVTENTSNITKSPKKLKQKLKSLLDAESNKENNINKIENKTPTANKSPTKQGDKLNNTVNSQTVQEADKPITNAPPKKKNKKRKKKPKQQTVQDKSAESSVTVAEETKKENVETNQVPPKKKNRKRKKSKSQENKPEAMEVDQPASDKEEDDDPNVKQSKKSKPTVNPNAITDKESDSEHESDDEIESENEEINKKVFESEPAADESSDEDEETEKKDLPQKQKAEKNQEDDKEKSEVNSEEDIKRTLFVGNVPFSAKCKKDIKKIFKKHGQIETIRIRTVPVKDGRYTPKLAVIKNELHPERTTVNVYIKYADADSVEKALSENNTVLNEHHLRVSRSSHSGAEHDPKCSVFVGNLPFAMEDEVLRQKFENCGEIESVRIIRDRKTNAGKGFGYVNFASKDGVELALALTEEDLTIKNRIIRVKRCTQQTNKQKQSDKVGFKKPFNQTERCDQRVQGNQRPNQGFQRGNQGGPRGNQGGPRGNQGGPRGNQGGPRGNQSFQRGNQGPPRGNQGPPRGNQGPPRQWNKDEEGKDGAHRRIMHKRKNQEGTATDGPPNKKQKQIIQPNKEKKSRKEFVGMTAEKKKKRKFDKGQKKKKALSEILTK